MMETGAARHSPLTYTQITIVVNGVMWKGELQRNAGGEVLHGEIV